MKRTTIHISAALALLLGIAACTQDEAGFLPEGAEGTPIVFTATGLNPDATATAGTRAPVDGNWEGVQSVAVRMDGTVKAYNVTPSTADNTSATLTSDEPHYWTNHDNITVTAWWPYTEGETPPTAVVVKADQSAREDFEASDLIVAEEQTVSYGNPTLRFTHRTAQITVVLTNYTEGLASVRLTGLSTENGNPAEIAPYDKGGDTYTALVAPQSVAAGTAFITCAFTNGKVFVYKMKNDTDWQAGEEYTYTVSLAAAKDPGYTVSEDGKTYTVYTTDGLLAWNEAVQKDMTLNCTLADNIDLTGIDWTPIGDYYNRYTGTFDGGGYTIKNLTITQSGNYVGMIDFLGEGGTVKNVTLENVNITGNRNMIGGGGDCVGSVVGDNYGTVIACTASGNVSGTLYVGGVVGYNNGTVTACYHASGNVSGTSNVGGVVGRNTSGTVTACYHAAGNVSGNIVGGAVGVNYATVTACYWSGLPDNDNGGATKVDGTTVTWQTAVDAMNAALQNAGSGWHYVLNGALPTLKKQ